jgi:L,D-transpeptidase catalytic domain
VVEDAAAHRRTTVLAALAATLLSSLLLISAAHAGADAVMWSSPTRADNSHFAVSLGSPFTLQLTARTSVAQSLVLIEPTAGLPRGARLDNKTGNGRTQATLRWTPAQVGEYTLGFRASSDGVDASPTRTYVVDVQTKATYPRTTDLIDSKTAHWAMVVRQVGVHATPNPSSRLVTTLRMTLPDKTQTLVAVLQELDQSPTETWYRVRLPILPNNSTGWVPASALGKLETVDTHLYVNVEKLRATLDVNGKAVFTTIIGAGHAYWPTPHGEFYIRTKLTDFNDPFYGPVAFATSARSTKLTDWPGGGFVGVHGTNQPQILPGYVSHGCIRMPNASILTLAKLMPVGTPLTVT